jgi:acetyl esterase/lipase
VYATPTTSGKQTTLDMDIQVPKSAGKNPPVVPITGGGFQLADHTANPDLRTYLAEQGCVVASIRYRTIRYLRAHADRYDIDGGRGRFSSQSSVF